MAISRVTTWSAGQVLTAAALNSEFNNVIVNPIALISPTTGAINFNLQSHTNLLPSALTATSGSTGNVLTYISPGVVGWSTVSLSTASTPNFGSAVMGLVGTITSSQTGGFAFDAAAVVTTARTASFQVNATSSFTVNAATAGPTAGGRDVSAAFASTYVHVYAITTGANSTAPAGILSTSPPPVGPVMPTNYSAFAYLCTVPWTSGSTEFNGTFSIRGPWVDLTSYQNLLSTSGSLTTSPQALSLATYVPPNAQEVKLQVTNRVQSSAVNAMVDGSLVIQSSGSQDHARVRAGVIAYGNIECPGVATAEVNIPNSTGQTFNYYENLISTGSGAIVYAGVIDLRGYRIANGG